MDGTNNKLLPKSADSYSFIASTLKTVAVDEDGRTNTVSLYIVTLVPGGLIHVAELKQEEQSATNDQNVGKDKTHGEEEAIEDTQVVSYPHKWTRTPTQRETFILTTPRHLDT